MTGVQTCALPISARTYVLQALNSGADVITANKALLATHGTEIFDVAEQVGAQLYFEAAVAAAIGSWARPIRLYCEAT